MQLRAEIEADLGTFKISLEQFSAHLDNHAAIALKLREQRGGVDTRVEHWRLLSCAEEIFILFRASSRVAPYP